MSKVSYTILSVSTTRIGRMKIIKNERCIFKNWDRINIAR